MKISLALSLALVTIPACMTSSDAPLDPTGTWGATLTWSTGTCMLTGSMPISMTVEHNTTGGLSIQGAAGRMVTGTALCSATQCQLSFTESGPGGNGIAQLVVSANLTSNEAEDIIGSGKAEITFTVGGSCQQQFIASGHRNIGVVSQ